MSAKYIRYSLITGNLIVAFLIFEISFYHLFDKEKQKNKWL
ncbi:hypothetical protein [Halobacillus campisalis]|uniref:Uncharacterized protein n=1 Tax=Halobacillus campisalis TaxID=435909 RepID=A0ABW2K1G7_9BACI|nr:hypothetical protein [Halobacillus campisalis]